MAKIKAQTTTFKIGSTTVGPILSISGTSISSSDIDVTHLGSTFKTYAPGLPEGGDVTIETLFDHTDTGQAALYADAHTPDDTETFTITLSNGDTYVWTGYVKSFELSELAVDGYVKASFGIKINSAITHTAA